MRGETGMGRRAGGGGRPLYRCDVSGRQRQDLMRTHHKKRRRGLLNITFKLKRKERSPSLGPGTKGASMKILVATDGSRGGVAAVEPPRSCPPPASPRGTRAASS